ncbi:hypothetical protein HYU12_00420 [Candidatus Woesearchaeota archaeon]|nr:hypothetical protein [Candidatus Woesearchaeota archaeon]
MDKPEIKKEITKLAITAIIITAVMKIAFYKQDIATTTRTALALIWMAILPGYAIMHYWKEKLDFTERIAIGSAAALGITAVTSYYLGLAGLHLKYQTALTPLAMLITGLIIPTYFLRLARRKETARSATKTATTDTLKDGTSLPK